MHDDIVFAVDTTGHGAADILGHQGAKGSLLSFPDLSHDGDGRNGLTLPSCRIRIIRRLGIPTHELGRQHAFERTQSFPKDDSGL